MLTKFESWRNYIRACQGFRRGFIAFVLGVVCVLALPPIYCIPALIPSFVGLIWLIDGSNNGSTKNGHQFRKNNIFDGSFIIGCCYGLGFFLAGTYWVALSFLVDAKQFAWMIPFVLFGLSSFFAVYVGLTCFLSFRLGRPGGQRVMYFSIFWVVFEWVRGWLFTGFPWNLIGTVWAFNEPMIQFASLFGVMGLSIVTVTAACSVALLGYVDKSARFRCVAAVVPLLLLLFIWVGGVWRLELATALFVKDVRLRIVQPNIQQKSKWKPELRGKHLNTLLSLSESPSQRADGRMPTHIIWPETATPFFLESNASVRRIISQIIPLKGALLTGSVRKKLTLEGGVQLWNSLHVVGPGAKILATFDKVHLVPFGEYIPFHDYLNKLMGVTKMTFGRTDFSSGLGRRAILAPGIPLFSPLICYEAIFSGAVLPSSANALIKPAWLLNITNDAWFGSSSGPYQHMAAAQMRAVEEGLPLIRVANTGISAVFDGYGRVIHRSNLNESVYVDSLLPEALNTATLFSQIKLFGLVGLIAIMIIISRLRFLR
jgi:apolipoprotein N-acyltransferase